MRQQSKKVSTETASGSGGVMTCTYSAVYVIVLRLLEEVTIRPLAVNHSTSHGNSSGHDVVQQCWVTSIAHSVDASLREGQVDGLGKVEWSG